MNLGKSMLRRLAVNAIGVIVLLPGLSRAQTMDEDLAWLASLGLPETKELSFKSAANKNAKHDPRIYYGFLLREDEKSYHLLSLDLTPKVLSKERLQPFKDARLADYANSIVEAMAKKKAHEVRSFSSGDSPFPNRSHLCVVALIAQHHGDRETAELLYNRAKLEPVVDLIRSYARKAPREESFRAGLEREVSITLLEQVLGGFGSPFPSRGAGDLSRPEILARLELLQTNFPKHADKEFIAEGVRILRAMIGEDKEHREIPAEELAKLPVPQQAEELLFALREARGGLSGNGDCYIDCSGLEKLGYEAVPRLIEALEDDRFTRGVRQIRWAIHSGAGTKIVRVGDVARRALQGITTEDFLAPSPLVAGDKTPKARAARRRAVAKARKWWAEFKKEGEEKLLASGVKGGGRDAATKSRRLATRYPNRAFQSIEAGLRVTLNDEYSRLTLLESLAKIQTKESSAIFQKEARAGRHLSCRVFSARTMFYRGQRKAAVNAMIQTWKERDKWPVQWSGSLEFLLSCDDSSAVHQIIQDYDGLDPRARYEVVRQLGAYRGLMGTMLVGRERAKYSKSFTEAIHDLLKMAARDDTVRWAAPDFYTPDPRIADAAVAALARWRREKFPKADDSSFVARERARFAVLKLLHDEDGGKASPLPGWLVAGPAASPDTVTEIEIRGLASQGLPAWLQSLPAMKGKPLDLGALGAFFPPFLADKDCQNRTLAIGIRRHSDGLGVHLLVDLFPRLEPFGTGWLINSWHSFQASHSYEKAGHWLGDHKENMAVATKLFPGDPEKEVRLRLLLRRR